MARRQGCPATHLETGSSLPVTIYVGPEEEIYTACNTNIAAIYLLHRSALLEYVALGTHFNTSKAVPLDAMEALGGDEV
jgi:hypothetical protein